MEENSYILHCYENLVAMATSNNCIFSLAVYSLLSPCIMCVQYRGGAQYREGVQYHGGYHEYCGGYLEYRGDVQYHGGYLEYRGGVQYWGNIMSTVGVFSTVGDIMMHMEGYHEYHGGCSVLLGIPSFEI